MRPKVHSAFYPLDVSKTSTSTVLKTSCAFGTIEKAPVVKGARGNTQFAFGGGLFSCLVGNFFVLHLVFTFFSNDGLIEVSSVCYIEPTQPLVKTLLRKHNHG